MMDLGAALLFIIPWFFGAVFGVAALIGFGKIGWRNKIINRKSQSFIQVQNANDPNAHRDVRSDAVFIGVVGLLCLFKAIGVMNSCSGSPRSASTDTSEAIFIFAMFAPFAVIGIMFSVMAVKGYKAWPTMKQLLAELDKTRCRKCGYNLFGLSEKRCPECGTSFEQSPPETPMN